MPEYLSPGVYVEEVNSGSKPIEGVSTSTAGMVGVTERGPENVPVLVTSFGEYRRVYGGELRLDDFSDNNDRAHAYMPHAVQGFFQNDGRRNYIVRVLPEDAERARRDLFDRGDAASADTMLLRAAPQGSGTATNLPLLYALSVNPPAVGDWIRIGDGSRSEYREVAAVGTGQRHIALNFPLGLAHDGVIAAEEVELTVDITNYTTGDFEIVGGANAGATAIVVSAVTTAADAVALLALPGDAVFEIGLPARAEYLVATAADDLGGGAVRLTLSTPLAMDYAAAVPVMAIELVAAATTANLDVTSSVGDSMIYVDALGGGFPNGAILGTSLVVIDPGTADMEVRRLGTLSQMVLDLPSYAAHRAGTRFELVTMTDHETSVVDPPPSGLGSTATEFDVASIDGLAVGMQIDVNGDPGIIDEIDEANLHLTLQAPLLGGAPANNDAVTPVTKSLTENIDAGRMVLSLDNRLGLDVDDVLRIGVGVDAEYVTIASVGGDRDVAPDSGTIVLTAPLQQAFAAGTEVARQLPPQVDNTIQPAITALSGDENADTFYVNDGVAYSGGDLMQVTLPAGNVFYHELESVDTTLTPRELTLDAADPLEFSHDAGAPLVERQAELTAANGLNPVISLSNFTNIEPGTVLEFIHPVSGERIGDMAKVVSVDRDAGEVELAAIPHPDVITAHTTLADNVLVHSREFELSVFLLQRPDPAVPSRNRTIIDSESFIVTMDPRHSRYLHKVIGTTWAVGSEQDDDGVDLRQWDRRSEGESRYIRVRDVAAGNTTVLESIRLGPEVLMDQLDSGQLQAARLPLSEGGDGLDSLINDAQGDTMYLGLNSDEPRLRTGIHALRNIQDISIVAVPGQTTVGVQQGLINHCENDRYRFAVLDAHAPNRDTLVDVQNQRQAFDTKYAALYHPWLAIPEPLPENLSSIRQMPIPPSGHMMGIYARVDNSRGVHKAPANEVVQGITGLTRSLNKREHDILNPFPKNINVVRDFREANRGLRVWGARCITSDSDYKYVNVRRLMIFLEASIDRGLQWVVFEPNAEPLWARVRRSVTNFLNVVWRNGALEGTTPEQAFFVRCDRTTMTQTDIDNGRLICEIGVAPVKPAEFVIVRIGLWTASAD